MKFQGPAPFKVNLITPRLTKYDEADRIARFSRANAPRGDRRFNVRLMELGDCPALRKDRVG